MRRQTTFTTVLLRLAIAAVVVGIRTHHPTAPINQLNIEEDIATLLAPPPLLLRKSKSCPIDSIKTAAL
jgi:hypothetical protein